jgi:hypothetical protein
MPSLDLMLSLARTIAATPFPVYGIVDRPLDLCLLTYGLGLTDLDQVVHVDLDFTSPRYSSRPPHAPQSQALVLVSIDARDRLGDREWTLDNVNLGSFLKRQIEQASNLFLALYRLG